MIPWTEQRDSTNPGRGRYLAMAYLNVVGISADGEVCYTTTTVTEETYQSITRVTKILAEKEFRSLYPGATKARGLVNLALMKADK